MGTTSIGIVPSVSVQGEEIELFADCLGETLLETADGVATFWWDDRKAFQDTTDEFIDNNIPFLASIGGPFEEHPFNGFANVSYVVGRTTEDIFNGFYDGIAAMIVGRNGEERAMGVASFMGALSSVGAIILMGLSPKPSITFSEIPTISFINMGGGDSLAVAVATVRVPAASVEGAAVLMPLGSISMYAAGNPDSPEAAKTLEDVLNEAERDLISDEQAAKLHKNWRLVRNIEEGKAADGFAKRKPYWGEVGDDRLAFENAPDEFKRVRYWHKPAERAIIESRENCPSHAYEVDIANMDFSKLPTRYQDRFKTYLRHAYVSLRNEILKQTDSGNVRVNLDAQSIRVMKDSGKFDGLDYVRSSKYEYESAWRGRMGRTKLKTGIKEHFRVIVRTAVRDLNQLFEQNGIQKKITFYTPTPW